MEFTSKNHQAGKGGEKKEVTFCVRLDGVFFVYALGLYQQQLRVLCTFLSPPLALLLLSAVSFDFKSLKMTPISRREEEASPQKKVL